MDEVYDIATEAYCRILWQRVVQIEDLVVRLDAHGRAHEAHRLAQRGMKLADACVQFMDDAHG